MANVPARGLPDGIDDLVRLAATGHRPAFARIVRLHHDRLVRVCLVITGDIGLARVAVAEAWAVAFRDLHGLDRPDRFRPWLLAIGADLARPLRPGSVLEVPTEPRAIDADLAPGAGYGAADPALAVALARLSPDDRALLALLVVGALDDVELGRALRLSPAAARTRLAGLLDGLATVPAAAEAPTADAGTTAEEAAVTVERRLRAFTDVPVRPVDVDAVARAAHAGLVAERRQLASVAVSALIATLLFATIYALTAEYAVHPALPLASPTPRPPAAQVVGADPPATPYG